EGESGDPEERRLKEQLRRHGDVVALRPERNERPRERKHERPPAADREADHHVEDHQREERPPRERPRIDALPWPPDEIAHRRAHAEVTAGDRRCLHRCALTFRTATPAAIRTAPTGTPTKSIVNHIGNGSYASS